MGVYSDGTTCVTILFLVRLFVSTFLNCRRAFGAFRFVLTLRFRSIVRRFGFRVSFTACLSRSGSTYSDCI